MSEATDTKPMAESGEESGPANCALCQRSRTLCRSHIVPEFMYVPGYDEKYRSLRVEAETGRRRLVQKGYREPLLCEDCERFLNDNYEKPFQRAWYERELVSPPPTDTGAFQLSGFNYAPFKLFHLSILWRASVAKGGGFQIAGLGPHQEPIRRMILEGDPGAPTEYPVAAMALLHEGELAHGVVMSPAVWKYEAMRVYTMIYGGFEWWIGVASHCPREMRNLLLTEVGTMQVVVQEWTDSLFVRKGYEKHVSAREDLLAV